VSADFWLGLALIPALAAAAAVVILTRRFVINRIQRLKPDANVHHRAAFAARVFAARRAYVWWTGRQRFAIAVTLGTGWPTQDQAEAVLLDEFAPVREEAR
jgi:hypothetical protein